MDRNSCQETLSDQEEPPEGGDEKFCNYPYVCKMCCIMGGWSVGMGYLVQTGKVEQQIDKLMSPFSCSVSLSAYLHAGYQISVQYLCTYTIYILKNTMNNVLMNKSLK